MEASSEDILRQIEKETDNLPEGEEESPVSSVTDEWPRTKHVPEPAYENPDPDEEVAYYYESRANLEQ